MGEEATEQVGSGMCSEAPYRQKQWGSDAAMLDT